jgi:predicted alpha/beta hydrolase family esterase
MTEPRHQMTGPASLGAFVAVSPFAQTLPTTGDDGLDAFAAHGLAPFLDGADLPGTRPHLGRVTVIRSDDDPLVVPALSDAFARSLEARVQVIPGARHFLEPHGVTELPDVLRALEDAEAPGA